MRCSGGSATAALMWFVLTLWSGVGLCASQTLVAGQSLNDDRWHSLFVRRRANTVQLGVDNSLLSTGARPAAAILVQ